jgi:hypothetical protein
MAPKKKKKGNAENKESNKQLHENELRKNDLIKKVQSLTDEIHKEHLLRDEFSNRKSDLECFCKDEKETIKVRRDTLYMLWNIFD